MSADSHAGIRVGCDIGGTFTDIVMALPDGRLYANKTSTTTDNLSRGITSGLQELIDEAGVSPDAIREVVHGTTTASNTILQKVGARTGLLTTAGFRDVLEIARIRTPTMFDLAWEKPEPLVARRYRRGVNERVSAEGDVLVALDADELRQTVQEMVDEGIDSLAICFLNSYKNPVHELHARRIVQADFPDLPVSISHDVLPEIKEYERTSTTAVNAYILPAMRTYLSRLKADLEDMGVQASLQIMASNGGMMGVGPASEKPVYAVASGPAGGVIGAAAIASQADDDEEASIVFDMGGTTAKASIILDGEPTLTTEYEFREGISAPSRFIKGGGYVLKVPAIDIAEVGAGGGSLATIDAGGLLCVGPASAGSDPGPACYARGNDQPTVTDANMVLGFLNPQSLAGGSLQVQPERSHQAIKERVAEPLGVNVVKAAHGVRHVANVNMARAIRAVTVERGLDPRGMTMVACGGGGPLHAVDLARLLGIRRVVAPVLAGVFSSVGMMAADAEHHFVRALLQDLATCDLEDLHKAADDMQEQGRRVMHGEGYDDESIDVRFSVDLRYHGQSSELNVPINAIPATDAELERLRVDFNSAYRHTFGYDSNEPVELVNLRLLVIGRSDHKLDRASLQIVESGEKGGHATREVSFDPERPPQKTRIVPRASITEETVAGPLIIEAYDTTIVIPPRCTARADAIGNIVIDIDVEDA